MKNMKDMSQDELIFIGHRINRLQKQAEEILPTTIGLEAANLGLAIVKCRLYREALRKEYNNRK
jgi:hypothetical protein